MNRVGLDFVQIEDFDVSVKELIFLDYDLDDLEISGSLYSRNLKDLGAVSNLPYFT